VPNATGGNKRQKYDPTVSKIKNKADNFQQDIRNLLTRNGRTNDRHGHCIVSGISKLKLPITVSTLTT
jgi:hypothetical protein